MAQNEDTLTKDNDDSGTVTDDVTTSRAAQIGAERLTASSHVREDVNATEALSQLVAQTANMGAQSSALIQMGMQQLLSQQADLHAQQMRHAEEMSAIRQRSLNLGNTFDSARDESLLTNAKMANAQRSSVDGKNAEQLITVNETDYAAFKLWRDTNKPG